MTDKEKAIDFLECRRAYYASLSTDPNPNVKSTKVCGYTLAESANACLMAIEALKLIPDNATNGEVIKALFPKYAKFQTDVQGVFLSDNDQTHICYTKDWWNAPYKRGDENADSD